METRAFSWAMVLLALAGCADAGDTTGRVELERPALSRCRDAWDSLTPLQQMPGPAPDVVRWQVGRLYYREWQEGFTSRLVALADSGGTPSEVTPDSGFGLWVEGDALLYSKQDRLYSVPVSGGQGMLVSDGDRFGDDRENVTLMNQALDAGFMYWVLHRYDDPTWSVWRMPREGGPSEQLGTLPDSFGYGEGLVVLPDRLLIAGHDGDAYAVPKVGGDAERLPSVSKKRDNVMWSRYLGAGELGIAWAVAQQSAEPKRIPYDIVLATPDGKFKELGHDMPSEFVPDHAWPDTAGGWVIAGTESFSDGEEHTSIWSLDARDRAKRLACDALPGRSSGFATTAALSGDAAYLVTVYLEGSATGEGTGWKLVAVGL